MKYLKTKQLELMRVICAANEDGSATDLDQILERLRYETSKESLQFSIRALVNHGLIEKKGIERRRGRQRVLIAATVIGAATFTRKKTPAYIVDEEADIIEEIF
jgi:DNA-binding PadR family transcriptional regulator